MTPLGRSILLLALVAVCAFPLFFRLGEAPIFGDETGYVRVAQRALRSGNWVPLRSGNEHFIDKPPLFVWASAAGMQVFGRGEFGARLATGVVGLLLCIVTARFGLRTGNVWTMALAPLLLISAPGLLLEHGLRAMVPEAWLLLGITASLLFYFETATASARLRLGGLTLLSLFSGWTKGPIGPIVVAGTLFLVELVLPATFAAAERTTGSVTWRRRALQASTTAAAAAIPGLLLGFGWLFFSVGGLAGTLKWLRFDLAARASTGVDPLHLQPLSIYFAAAWRDFGPLAILAPLGLGFELVDGSRGRRTRRNRSPEETERRRALLLLLFWLAIVYLLFGAARSRLTWYIFPAYPAFALASALLLDRLRTRLVAHRGGLALFVLLVSGILAVRGRAVAAAWPAPQPHSLARLHRLLDADPTARAYLEPELAEGAALPDRVAPWHRFYLRRYKALVARALPAGAPACSFVVTTDPEAWRAAAGTPRFVATPVPSENPGQHRLYVIDLCDGRFADGAR